MPQFYKQHTDHLQAITSWSRYFGEYIVMVCMMLYDLKDRYDMYDLYDLYDRRIPRAIYGSTMSIVLDLSYYDVQILYNI